MCHGYEWELIKAAQMREIARRKREEESKPRAPVSTPAQPAPSPVRNEEPVPA